MRHLVGGEWVPVEIQDPGQLFEGYGGSVILLIFEDELVDSPCFTLNRNAFINGAIVPALGEGRKRVSCGRRNRSSSSIYDGGEQRGRKKAKMATICRVLRRASVTPRSGCSATLLKVLGSEKVHARRWYSSPSPSPSSPRSPPQCATMEAFWMKDYFDYRRSVCGEVTHRALLVDIVGTLIVPSQPTAQIYRSFGQKYGVKYSEDEILRRYRWAYGQPWGGSRLRYVADGRPFWQYIVRSSTGCSDSQYFEELYEYYTTDKAWRLCDPDAEKILKAIRRAGVKLAVVSNFDTRLRPLLQALKCDEWFDAVAVSAEVEAEKPNPTIFLKACELLGVKPEDAVHVGDDRRNDIWGARDAGCDAWLWGSDVHSFREVAQRIGVQV